MSTRTYSYRAGNPGAFNSRARSTYVRPLIAGIVVTFASLIPLDGLTAIGLGIFAYSLVRYVESLGHSLAIIEIMSLIASTQWIAAPLLAYALGNLEPKYRMYVTEPEYMSFAVPGVLVLILGMEMAKGRTNFGLLMSRLRSSLNATKGRAYLFILVGLIAGFVSDYVPAALRFVFFFIAQLKFIGVLYLIFSNDRRKWLVAGAIWLFTASTSLDEGMFHNLILWTAFIFSFVCLEKRFSLKAKWLYVLVGMIAVVMLQSIKADYREKVFEQGYSGSKVALAVNLIIGTSQDHRYRSLAHRASSINTRFNQGWIISAVMNYVPRIKPYAQGATIAEAVKDSLVPRFLVEKKRVWVSEKFREYTGIMVSEKTSMGISLLGEGYVNFGKMGGVLFMLVWGLFVGLLFRGLIVMARKRPTLILWAPLIFLQAVKAETELLVVLNHLIKALVFTAMLYFFANRFLRWNI